MKKIKYKIKSLPRSKNGKRRKGCGFAAYGYQKEFLKKQARKAGVSVSYFVNMKLWANWL